MGVYADKQRKLGMSRSVSGLGNQYQDNMDPNTSEGLYNLAMMNGGRSAEVISQLAHPRKGILSSVGDVLKKAGKGVIDILSTGNEIVAGTILGLQSNGLSLSEGVQKALKEDLTTSDVLLGDYNKTGKTGLQKVGNFAVRFALDTLLDPLTYLTFGAARGVVGLSSARKFTAGTKLAQDATARGIRGITAGKGVALAEGVGDDMLDFVTRSVRGEDTVELAGRLKKAGISDDVLEKSVKEVAKQTEDLLKTNILDADAGREAMKRLLDIRPELIETIMDKGGIKFFGKTILEGQKISAAAALIPGMKALDTATEPMRMAIGALFDPTIQKVDGKYKYIPQEYVNFERIKKASIERAGTEIFQNFDGAMKSMGIKSKDEVNSVLTAIQMGQIPADPKLAELYKWVHQINDVDSFNALRAAGINVTYLPNRLPNIISKTEVAEDSVRNASNFFNTTVASAKQKQNVTFEGVETGATKLGIEGDKLEKVFVPAEKRKIQDAVTDEVAKFDDAISEAEAEIVLAAKQINNKFTERAQKAIGSVLSKNGVDKSDKIAKHLTRFVGNIDIEKSVKNRLSKSYKDGVLIKQIKNLDADVADGVVRQLKLLNVDTEQIKNILESSTTTRKATTKGAKEVSEEADRIVRELTTEGIDFDEESVKKFVQGIADEMELDSVGIKKLTDNIIKNKQSIQDYNLSRRLAIQAGDMDLKQFDSAIMKQVKILDDKIADIEKSGLFNTAKVMEDLIEQKKALQRGDMGNVFIDKESGEMFIRRAATLDETLQIKGFDIKDVDLTETLMQKAFIDSKQIIGMQFTNDLAKFGTDASQAPSHFVKLDYDSLGFNLSGVNGEELLFDPLFADSIKAMAKSMAKEYNPNAFLEAYDKVLSVAKASLTTIFPSFHARNAVSNTTLNFMDIGYHSMDPRKWNTAGDIIAKDFKYKSLVDNIAKEKMGSAKQIELQTELSELMSKTIFDDRHGHSFTFGELRDILIQKDIAFTHNATVVKGDDFIGTTKTIGDQLFPSKPGKIAKGMLPVFNDFYGYKVGRELGGQIENHGRLINFLANLEATGDISHAATRTKQFLFDYGNLTDFERNFMRRIIPFYSFTRFNIELQAKALMTTPGKSAQVTRAYESFNDLFSQEELTDEQKALLPEYMQDGFMALRKSKDGTLKAVTGFESPIAQPLQALSAKGILGSVSPLIRVPLEQLTGYDMYQGKVFSDVTNAAAYKKYPKAVKDFIGYDEISWTDPETGETRKWQVSLRPARMNLLNNLPPTSRVINAFRDVTNEDRTVKERAMRTLFGINTYDVDFERLEKQREKELLKQYSTTLDTAGVIYRFQKNIIPKE